MELKFPYTPRLWQPQAIDDLSSFIDSPAKYAVLVASCGEGKESVMAMTVLKWVLGGGKVVWLTAKGATGEWNKRKELEACLAVNNVAVKVAFLRAKEDTCLYRHEWAKERGVKTPPAIEFCAVARSKCPYSQPNRTQAYATIYNDTRHFIDEKQVPEGSCPYYFLREAIKEANIIIADYNYVVHPIIRTVIMKAYSNFIDKKTLILFDEAHLLQERAKGTIRGLLSTRTINKAIDDVRGRFLIKKHPKLIRKFRVDESTVKALLHIRHGISDVVQRKSMEIKHEFEVVREEKAKIQYYDFMDKQIEESIKLLKRRGKQIAKFKFKNEIGVISWTSIVANFLERFVALKGRRWMLNTCGLMKTGNKKHPYVTFVLLDPWVSVAKALRLCGKVIFYSGTLHDENFAAIFRLREYEPFKDYPPSFPPENRLDIFVSDGKIVRDYYETDKGAQRISEGIIRWYQMVKQGKNYVVMTHRLYERLSPFLKDKGLKTNVVPLNVPKSLRKKQLKASFSDPTVSVSLSPYSWASSSCDIKDCISVLTIGIPVAKLTLERRETIEYFRRLLREGEPEKEKAAWVRIAIIPALENAVQASERARRFTDKDRISHVWMDERYVRKRGYHGHIKTLTGATNVKFAHTLEEMEGALQNWCTQ